MADVVKLHQMDLDILDIKVENMKTRFQLRDPYFRIEKIRSIAKDARDTLGRKLQCLLLPLKKELLHLSDRFIAHPGDNEEQADKQEKLGPNLEPFTNSEISRPSSSAGRRYRSRTNEGVHS